MCGLPLNIEKLFTQNITFIFETYPITKPKEKKSGGTWPIMSPPV